MAISKSSLAIDSFLEYFKDAKPYHTKLLEIIEEYNFFEDMFVLVGEDVTKEIAIQNEPLCKETGFGVDYDDECGYDAIDCCDLFDCEGGYGFIYDNSDLVVETSLIDKNDEYGILNVEGNQISDTRIPVIDIVDSTTAILQGDISDILDKHSTFIFVNVLQFEVVSNDSNTIRISGNLVDFINTKSNFKVEGTETEYNGTYTVSNVEYDVTNNNTIIEFIFFKEVSDNGLQGVNLQFRNSNPNGGIYQLDSYTTDGVTTTVNVTSNTFDFTDVNETRLGSFQFRTGLKQPREIDIVEAEHDYHRILYSGYDAASNQTQIFVDNEVSSYTPGSDTVKMYGYFYNPGFDGEEECTKPKDSHVYSLLEENLTIEIDDTLINPAPTPTPTPTPSNIALVWIGTTGDWDDDSNNAFNVSYDGACFDIEAAWGGTSESISYTANISPIYGFRFELTLMGSAGSTDVDISINTNAGSITDTVSINNGDTFLYEKDETSGIFDGVSSLEPATIIITPASIGSYDTIDLCNIEVLTEQQ